MAAALVPVVASFASGLLHQKDANRKRQLQGDFGKAQVYANQGNEHYIDYLTYAAAHDSNVTIYEYDQMTSKYAGASFETKQASGLFPVSTGSATSQGTPAAAASQAAAAGQATQGQALSTSANAPGRKESMLPILAIVGVIGALLFFVVRKK